MHIAHAENNGGDSHHLLPLNGEEALAQQSTRLVYELVCI